MSSVSTSSQVRPSVADSRAAGRAPADDALDEATGMPQWALDELRTWPCLHPEAAALEGAAPGPSTVEYLHVLDPSTTTELGLVEGIAAWERVIGWATARQATLAAELLRRSESSHTDEFLADEIAARLATTGQAARRMLERAAALDQLPVLEAELGSGRADVRKVDTLVRATRHLHVDDARAIVDEVAPRAAALTAPQVRAEVRRAELRLDASAVERRHAVSRAERHVTMTPAPDGMAFLTAYLPATDAATVMTALDGMAAVRAPDDERCVDERRADALTRLARRVLDSGVGLDGPLPVRQHRRPHLSITVSAATVMNGWDGAAHLDGYGPLPARLVREVAEQADWCLVVTHPSTGEAIARSRGTFRPERLPCAERPVDTREGADLARTAEPERTADVERTPSSEGRGDVGRAAGLELPATTATAETGPRGRTGYRPPPSMVALVVERDGTCTFPGCGVPATRCDVDHVVPWDPARPGDDQTHPDNLQALCRHHHRLKTHGRWRVERDAGTGRTTWTSPNGRVVVRPPRPVDPDVAPPI